MQRSCLTAGSLADLFGRRRLFAVGLAVFTLGSLACGLADGAVDPRPCPRRPGCRWRDHVRNLAGVDRTGVPRAGARTRVRSPRRHHRRCSCDRPGARRSADERPFLAVDLLRQSADRRVRTARDAHQGRGVAQPGRETARHPRLPHLQHRPRGAHLRAHQQQRRRLDVAHGRRLARRRGRPPRLLPGCGTRAARADVRSRPSPRPDLRGRAGRSTRRQRVAVRAADLPHPLLPAGSRAVSSPDRGALPAADDCDLLRLRNRRSVERARAAPAVDFTRFPTDRHRAVADARPDGRARVGRIFCRE